MKSILLQVDDRTYELLNQVAPPASRGRARFLRQVILEGILKTQEERTRAAYLAQPDSEADSDAWEEPEEFRP